MDLSHYFTQGWGTFYSLYVVAQIVALIFVRGPLLWLALIPILPMPWLGVETVQAYHRAAQMWGMGIDIFSPFALLYIVIVIVISRLARKK